MPNGTMTQGAGEHLKNAKPEWEILEKYDPSPPGNALANLKKYLQVKELKFNKNSGEHFVRVFKRGNSFALNDRKSGR